MQSVFMQQTENGKVTVTHSHLKYAREMSQELRLI